jgi:hypothetical protein
MDGMDGLGKGFGVVVCLRQGYLCEFGWLGECFGLECLGGRTSRAERSLSTISSASSIAWSSTKSRRVFHLFLSSFLLLDSK